MLRFDGDLVKKFLNTLTQYDAKPKQMTPGPHPSQRKELDGKNILGINKSWCISLDSWKMKKAKALQDVQIRTVPRRYLTFPH